MDTNSQHIPMLDALIRGLIQGQQVGGSGCQIIQGVGPHSLVHLKQRPHFLILATSGRANVSWGSGNRMLQRGDLALVPARHGPPPGLVGCGEDFQALRWSFHLGRRHQSLDQVEPLITQGCSHLSGFMSLAQQEGRLNDPWRMHALVSALALILIDLRRRFHREPGVATLSPNQCQSIELFLADAGPGEVSSADLAKVCDLSREHFVRLVRRTYGVSVRRLVLAHRLRQAANLLNFSQTSVKDIAAKLGYVDVSLFCRQFKTLYGVTPLQHRKRPGHAHLDLWAPLSPR